MVKAGAFDEINSNRQYLFNSIPNIILKSKNNFENKSINQIGLFDVEDDNNDNIQVKIKDWSIEERLSKEFETLGFFISDHPLNQFKYIYKEYKIIDFADFNTVQEIKETNIAATVLNIQEKKTQKGNSYAIVKFSDLSSVFELFIFSDIFEMNRKILVEGNSLIITLVKNLSDEENRFKRINVKKIALLKELINKPIKEIQFKSENIKFFKSIFNLSKTNAQTEVKLVIKDNGKNLIFKLKDKRYIDRKTLESLNDKAISSLIN